MATLPTGTVTLVFTDIEGSTRLLHHLGDAYEDVLATHRRLLREAFSSHGGIEVDTQGDALFYGFSRARDAVLGAASAQRSLAAHDFGDGIELRVRIGIHSGDPTVTPEGYVGADVHLGARICSAAHGGQVVVSDATAGLLPQDLEGISLRSLGEHLLKDIDDPVVVHQVVGEGMAQDFPPLRTPSSSHPTNLPARLEPLIGRDDDVAALVELVGSHDVSVVTLVGPGGTGKTRVALAVGTELLASMSDGVFFVDLSALTDASLVVPAIAHALSLREAPGRSLSEGLAEHLSSREMLLILDNFEQVVEAASEVSSVVTGAPGLKVVVTSREALRIQGERVVSLPPLAVPSPEQADLEEVARSPAVALFAARARAVKAGFALTPDNASDVAGICRRLDGLPLALELAAARVNLLAPSALLSRLDAGLKVLTSGRRDAAARQRTLRGAIAWSYDLLSPGEQALFRRLGVFAGGFTLEAAEQVCDRGDLDTDVLDGLASLVDKSLVRAVEERFSMLETIRDFAQEKLEESGEADDLRRAHAEFFMALAEEAEPHLVGPDQKRWLDRIEREQSNVREVLDWSSHHDIQLQLLLVAAIWRLWYMRAYITEGVQWLKRAIDAPHDEVTPALAKALRALAIFLDERGDYVHAEEAARRSLRAYKVLGDEVAASNALETLATVAENLGELESAEMYYREALRICEEIKDERGAISVANNLGDLAIHRKDWETAKQILENNVVRARRIKDEEGLAYALLNLAVVVRRPDPRQACVYLKEGLSLARALRHSVLIAYCLEAFAAVAATSRPTLATASLSKAGQLYEEMGIRLGGADSTMHDETTEALRAAVGPTLYDTALAKGRLLPLAELIVKIEAWDCA